jgi:hypothetical protein
MYCLINEAWPEYNNYNKIEHTNEYKPNMHTKEHFQSVQPIQTMQKYSCSDFLEHLESCPECTNIIIKKYSNNNLNELFKLNPQLKETILIFLIGIVILLIINLFYS